MKPIYTQSRKVGTDSFTAVVYFLLRPSKVITKTLSSYCLLQRGVSHSSHALFVRKVFTIVTENVAKEQSQMAGSVWFLQVGSFLTAPRC